MSKYLFPKLSDILFIALMALVLLYGPRTFNLDGDLGRHITIGNYILDTGKIPRTDLFSHTMMGQPLTPHEWLAQVIFALVHRWFGLSGIVFVTACIIAAAFTLVYKESLQRKSSRLIALALTFLAAAASSLHWLARPHIFTFLYLAIWMSLHERIRVGGKISLWIFGIVMLLWANTHGAFIAGFVVWGAYLVGAVVESLKKKSWFNDEIRRWISIGILSLAVTLINPAGIRLLETSFGFISNRYLVNHTQEYLPPDFHNPGSWPFLMMATLLIFALAIKRDRLPFSIALLVSGWFAMAIYSARNIPLFAIVAAPILSSALTYTFARLPFWQRLDENISQLDRKLKGGIWVAGFILIAGVFVSTPAMQQYNVFNASVFPKDAVDWLDEHPQDGHMFNYFTWGGYLLYRQWPGTLVFIDGQTDFYGEALTREYEQVITAQENWEQILEKYQVEWILIPENSLLAKSLADIPAWRTIYSDDCSIIFRKNQ